MATPGEFALSPDGEFGGHELVLLDFDPAAVARLRRIGRVIAAPAAAGVSSSLAIAGSAAQGRIQPYPADVDFFERIHIAAATIEDARGRLAELLRRNIAAVDQAAGFRLQEVCFGLCFGAHLRWTCEDVSAGMLDRRTPAGGPLRVAWTDAAGDPGFIKLDWLLTDRTLGGPGQVTKVIDATWAAPDGSIVSLDGLLDADFQQVYLDRRSADLAILLTHGLPAAGRDEYLRLMEREVAKHCRADPADYVKVAKRLYNICRLTRRYAEALFIRELFDEPVAQLHQARARVELARRLPTSEAGPIVAEIVALMDDLLDGWIREETMADLREVVARLPRHVAPDAVMETIDVLDRALATAASRGFAHRLRAYQPVAALLLEITARHAGG